MRQLLPPRPANSAETPAAAIYGDIRERAEARAADRPYVVLNMVSSVDGVITLDGLSGGLSGAADKDVFFFLRGIADVILAGASTVRAENYGPARLAPDVVAERERRGQDALPRIAVVTRSMKLDWSARLFAPMPSEPMPSEPKPGRPYVICPSTRPEAEHAAAARVADVIATGETNVDFAEALRALAADGVRLVLGEGGPTLNGELLAAGLVDEVCLTLSPGLVGGTGQRLSGWTQSRPPLALELLTVAEAENTLLLRYAVKNALQD